MTSSVGELERRDVLVEAAVEVRRALEPAGRRVAGSVHLAEQAEDEVVGAAAPSMHVLDGAGEDVARQQADVFGEHRHDRLQDESLRGVAIDPARR